MLRPHRDSHVVLSWLMAAVVTLSMVVGVAIRQADPAGRAAVQIAPPVDAATSEKVGGP